ncbi:MAG: glycosyltransferase [Candidatus Omnitrophota bacterium]
MPGVSVSIVIVTAGKGDFIKNCLCSLGKQSFRDTQVIVIDNSLLEHLSLSIVREFPSVRILKNELNMFYCRSLDQGIAVCEGKFILCLNDDVVLEGNFIEEALKGFSVSPDIGMVSGKILRADKKTLDSTGLFLSPWRTAVERGYGTPDEGRFARDGYVFGVNGAVAFYRKALLDGLKVEVSPGVTEYFDNDLAFFYEDLDICWRAQNAGWKAYYVPSAIAYHVRGATARRAQGINKRFARFYLNDELNFYLVKNRCLTIIKNEKLICFLMFFPLIFIYDAVTFIYLIFCRPAVLRFFFDPAIPFQSAFRKRQFIKKLKRR